MNFLCARSLANRDNLIYFIFYLNQLISFSGLTDIDKNSGTILNMSGESRRHSIFSNFSENVMNFFLIYYIVGYVQPVNVEICFIFF